MDRRTFLTGCLCCAAVPLLTSCGFKTGSVDIDKYIKMRSDDENPDYPWLSQLEIHLTEHCNLGCKYCSHFSSIAEESYYDVTQFEREMKRLSELTKKHIECFNLLGGEPLLHPQINEFIEITRKYLPYTNIRVLTNGLLLDSMPDSFWIALKDNYINLVPTIYNVKLNWESIFKKAEKFGLKITTLMQEEVISEKNIKKFVIDYFYKLNIDPSGGQDASKYCLYKTCFQFWAGKIYTCFAISNIRHFNKKFGKNVPVVDSDYIDIFKAESLQEILDFLARKEFHFCKYCAGTCDTGEKWTTLKEHSIDEWLYDEEFFRTHLRTDIPV